MPAISKKMTNLTTINRYNVKKPQTNAWFSNNSSTMTIIIGENARALFSLYAEYTANRQAELCGKMYRSALKTLESYKNL
jgi:hypothetical protein